MFFVLRKLAKIVRSIERTDKQIFLINAHHIRFSKARHQNRHHQKG